MYHPYPHQPPYQTMQIPPPAPPPPPPPPPPGPNPAQSLCCTFVQPHQAVTTHWEYQFMQFLGWLSQNSRTVPSPNPPPATNAEFVIRLTTDITFGRTCGTTEFVAFLQPALQGAQNSNPVYSFVHVPPGYAGVSGFLGDRAAYKNYRCAQHNLYMRLDLHRRPQPT
ncbi:hypothetical protein BKA62DRAFT_262639 [Auriculariales sp. MPI-PUGE-AT-0066]|nr:hypothetical protein BKA62DRAFT_262639 [Auriculariales sp. MPI-PUGE-AT-0066]